MNSEFRIVAHQGCTNGYIKLPYSFVLQISNLCLRKQTTERNLYYKA